ncbi:probable WRKY transcription factor 57 [Elaeis guineensis]|uniref:Probable WRKY transcription factor 57 n=1 Tax=Elaeis guineensis var. tenera TaxID=51953 RepID=A0A6I9RFY7_ELAGV|nr:probable WRKY transcription factor 57 [Elaeis guineensis]
MAAPLGFTEMSYPSFFLEDSPAGVPGCYFFPVEVSDESMLGVCNGVATDEALFEDSLLAGDLNTLVSSDCSLNAPTTGLVMNCGNDMKRMKVDAGCRIGFRTKSDVDILDDGFKWRKYGKKSVKNSPNPRNYYRCSHEGCAVKKRVERDPQDSSYVITTYEGVHNHASPSTVRYEEFGLHQAKTSAWESYAQLPLVVPNVYRMQAAHSSY